MNLKLFYPLKTFQKHPPNFKVKILLFQFNTVGFHCGSAGKEFACNEVQFLGWEDPLEKGKAPHSSILD